MHMNNRNTMISLFILLLACLGNQNALARTVYQWTDEAGNVNFSDVPPDKSVVTETREISINQHDPDNVDFEKYSIINQVEQMAAWRRQITEERLEKKKLILEEKRLAHEIELGRQNEAIATEEYYPRTYYYAPYRSRFNSPHGFRHHSRHGIDRHPHRIDRHPHRTHRRATSTQSRRNRNIIPRRFAPVHL